MSCRLAGPVLRFAVLALVVTTCSAGLLSRPKRRANSERSYGLLGNLVASALDAAFGIKRNASMDLSPMQDLNASDTGHGTQVLNLTEETSATDHVGRPMITNTTAEVEATGDVVTVSAGPAVVLKGAEISKKVTEKKEDTKPKVPLRWQRSADRFRKMVEPFLLQFKSPDDHVSEALGRLKSLEATERAHNPRYIGGFSEL